MTKKEQLSKEWPGISSIERLVQMSSPLFIQAATFCRLLADQRHGEPSELLRDVLRYQKTSQEAQLDATYLPVLEKLLAGVSATGRQQDLQRFKLIVDSIIILASPLSTTSLSKVLSLPRSVIECQLSMLHSVLSVPQSANTPVRLLHSSSRDFLLAPGKHVRVDFWIEEATAHARMLTGCLAVMRGFLKEDMCDLPQGKREGSNVDPEAIGSFIPEEIQYACRHWISHFEKARGNSSAHDVPAFLDDYFLHWTEALALVRRTVESVSAVNLLISTFKV